MAATALLAVGAGVALATTFTDVPDTLPHKEHIDLLVDHGIAAGFDDGTFRPGDPVTRRQAARWSHVHNGTTRLVSDTVNAPASATASTRNVSCATGERAIGGGGRRSDSGRYLSDSSPSPPASGR